LITQNRQTKDDQRHARLDLQISLLIDQRCAKMIEMLQGFRRDLPELEDQNDPVGDILSTAVNAQEVASELEARVEEMLGQEPEAESEPQPNSSPNPESDSKPKE